jgi:TPR repeat protein
LTGARTAVMLHAIHAIGGDMKPVLLAIFLLFLAPSQGLAAVGSVESIAIDAALGDPNAIYNLAVEFYTGRRVSRDYGKSAVLWERAASLGVVSARNNLGFLLYYGKGVRADQPRAVALWRDAAGKGHDEARLHLGVAISDGKGTKRDQVLGAGWLICAVRTAAALNHAAVLANARTLRDDLLARMDKTKRQQAAALASRLCATAPPLAY